MLAVPALADKPLGVDVSGWETLTPAQWTEMYNGGRVFGFARASYGYGYSDTQFVTHMTNGTNAGLYMGAYHFSYPMYTAGNTAVNEANTFLNVARNYIGPGYLRPVLDVEWNGAGLSKAALSAWVNAWINHVQSQTGVEAMIYCNTNFATNYLDSSVAGRTLWIANWPANPNPQTGDPPTGVFPEWAFWQYAGDVPLGTVRNVDLNVFNGTFAQLQSYVVGLNASISLSTHSLSRIGYLGQNAADSVFTISNSGSGTLNYTITDNVDWLAVNPASGASSGEADTITVNYSTLSLPIGTHNAAIQVVGVGANNSPQTITVTLTVQAVPGDIDMDGSIDQVDVALFRNCMTAPGQVQTDPACARADLDGDGDVEQSDFGRLQRCLGATGERPDPNCGG